MVGTCHNRTNRIKGLQHREELGSGRAQGRTLLTPGKHIPVGFTFPQVWFYKTLHHALRAVNSQNRQDKTSKETRIRPTLCHPQRVLPQARRGQIGASPEFSVTALLTWNLSGDCQATGITGPAQVKEAANTKCSDQIIFLYVKLTYFFFFLFLRQGWRVFSWLSWNSNGSTWGF